MVKVLFIALFPLVLLLYSEPAFAQGKGHGHGKRKHDVVVVKHKGPPPWAPAHGYRHRHIFFPDYRCYYDNTNDVYIYINNGKWEISTSLPLFLKGVDLKVTEQIELELDDIDNPQSLFDEHVKLYVKAKR